MGKVRSRRSLLGAIVLLAGAMLLPAGTGRGACDPRRVPRPRCRARSPARPSPLSLRYNSRIDKGRSKIVLTAPDKSQSTPADRPGRAGGYPHDHGHPAARRLYAALAGAGDRRPHHARRLALHRHGSSLKACPNDESPDRPVRLSLRHPARLHHRRPVDDAGRRAVLIFLARRCSGSSTRPASTSCAAPAASPSGAGWRWWPARWRPPGWRRRSWSARSISAGSTRSTRNRRWPR